MSHGEDKAKRWRIWRPRFSVRTLAIFVTLVCVYFGAWEATKRYGVTTKKAFSPMPFVVIRDGDAEYTNNGNFLRHTLFSGVADLTSVRTYHLWLFGRNIKLPLDSNVVPEMIRQRKAAHDAQIRKLRDEAAR